MAQRALDRWWPSMMFGPPDTDSPNTARSMRGIKRYTNDELRQQFVDATVPQADLLGLTVPDPDLVWNEGRATTTSASRTGTSSRRWSRVRARSRTCISTRRNAHAEGEWVREAAVAYAEKQQQREQSHECRLAAREVFVRARRGLSHTHVGSVQPPTADGAADRADLFTRRQK